MTQPTMRGTVTIQLELNDFPDGSAQDVVASIQHALGSRISAKVVSAFLVRQKQPPPKFNRISTAARCTDCGEQGEQRGHMGCQYPS